MTDGRKQEYEEDFYVDYLQGGGRKRRSISHVGLFFIVFICFVVILWFTYPRGAEKYNMVDVPIIRADTGSYKEKPVNRGGLEILHQDSSVFAPLGDVDTKPIEHLLPQSEEPVDRKHLKDVVSVQKSERVLGLKLQRRTESLFDKQVINKVINEGVSEEPEVKIRTEDPVIGAVLANIDKKLAEPVVESIAKESVVAEKVSKPVFVPQPKPKALAKKARENLRWQKKKQQASRVEYVLDKKTSTVRKVFYPKGQKRGTETRVTPTRATAKMAGVKKFIQLGAFKSRKDAERRWVDVLSKNSDLLYGLKSRVQYANLGKKGIFYRLQAGPLVEATARSICDSLKNRQIGGCIVVKP